MTHLLTNRVFNDARKALVLATRVDALQCLSAVRRLVAEILTSLCADASVVRLVTSDLAETLLARESLRIAQMPSYRSVTKTSERESLLEIALVGYLFDWTLERTSDASQHSIVLQGAQLFANQLTGAKPS